MKSASQKAFESLPNVSKAVSALTVLKGVGPATASAVLAAYAPDVAPFMSDEVIFMGNCFGYFFLCLSVHYLVCCDDGDRPWRQFLVTLKITH